MTILYWMGVSVDVVARRRGCILFLLAELIRSTCKSVERDIVFSYCFHFWRISVIFDGGFGKKTRG